MFHETMFVKRGFHCEFRGLPRSGSREKKSQEPEKNPLPFERREGQPKRLDLASGRMFAGAISTIAPFAAPVTAAASPVATTISVITVVTMVAFGLVAASSSFGFCAHFRITVSHRGSPGKT